MLSIPARPSSSSGNAAADAASASQRPRLPTPLLHTHTTINACNEEEVEAYDGYLPQPQHHAPSIYPDTVPGPLTDQAALTNDLKRAIKGSCASEDYEGDRSPRPSFSSKSTPSLSARSQGTTQSSYQPAPPLPCSTDKRWGPLDDGPLLGTDSQDDEEMVLKGQLETLSRLGEGASGEVRKARHIPSGTIMAVKVSRSCKYLNT